MEKVAGWCIRLAWRDRAMQIDRAKLGAIFSRSPRPRGGDKVGGEAERFSQLLESPAGDDAAPCGGMGASAAAEQAASVARTEGLMTYESAFERVGADRNARRHGRAMLRALGALQVSLLDGGGTEAQALAQLAAGVPEADDPILRLILREIGVRAAVELARRGAAANISIG
jgi:hypothetical protein